MDIKNKITRLAVASLTIGALAIAGFATAAPAFADGDGVGVPDSPNGDGGLVAGGVTTKPQIIYVYVVPDPAPAPVIDPNYYPVTPVYPVYPTYTTYSYPTTQTQGLFVTGTAEVMGIDVNSVLLQLSQGRTLTQIAADRGWTRDYFLSLLVTRVQSDLIYGINSGTIDPATGNSLLANLVSQASIAVDQPGLQSYAPQSVYGVFPVAPY